MLYTNSVEACRFICTINTPLSHAPLHAPMNEGEMDASAVFHKGSYDTKTSSCGPPDLPCEVLVAYPTEEREYSVVVLFHGFLLTPSCYREIMNHVASHGYIVLAPQLSFVTEINDGVSVLNWLSEGLQSFLNKENPKVKAKTSNLALSGHSRGGKAAFYIALSKEKLRVAAPIKVLIGIDPVAGLLGIQFSPEVLTYKPCSFDLQGLPVLVIGAGLGSKSKWGILPSCAPAGLNHQEFYNECQPPCFHLVATDYGHMDMLDDPSEIQKFVYCQCVSGTNKEAMRRFVGGIMVAFLQAYLDQTPQPESLNAILADPTHTAPIQVEIPIQYVKKEEAPNLEVEGEAVAMRSPAATSKTKQFV